MISLIVDGERVLQQDDGRLILASHDLGNRIANITSQDQQLAQIVNLVPHSAIPITFTKVSICINYFSIRRDFEFN